MKYLAIILLFISALLVGCAALDSAAFKAVDTPVLNADGTQMTDAEGNPVFERTYENSAILSAGVKMAESLPGGFGLIGSVLGAALAGFSEYRRKTIVKTKDGQIKELESDKSTLSASLAAVAKARNELWDRLDGIEGGQNVIQWFDEFAKSNAVQTSQEVAKFLLDTLAMAETPTLPVDVLKKLETFTKGQA